MASSGEIPGLSDKIALELMEPLRKTRDVEVPIRTLDRIREAYRIALHETIKAWAEDQSIDFMTALKINLGICIRISKEERGPLIFVVPENRSFKQSKANPLRILLIQPQAPKVEHFEEKNTPWGKLFVIKLEHREEVERALRECLSMINKMKPDFTCLPELHFFKVKDIEAEFSKVAVETDSFIIAGSFHDEKEMANICLIFCPDGSVIEQRKFYRSKEVGEGIRINEEEILRIIDFTLGRFCVLVCIDSEAETVRDVLKERLLRCRCPELIFNPSFTGASDRACEQLNNLMSLLFAATIFCNANAKGGSCTIYPAVELSKDKFKTCKLGCSETTMLSEIASLDISELQAYKQAKMKCLIAMKT